MAFASKAGDLCEGLSSRLEKAKMIHNYVYNHHQWAESLNDSDYWHAADFGYTIDFDLNDIRYLDLIYAVILRMYFKS